MQPSHFGGIINNQCRVGHCNSRFYHPTVASALFIAEGANIRAKESVCAIISSPIKKQLDNIGITSKGCHSQRSCPSFVCSVDFSAFVKKQLYNFDFPS